jgi:hypothetical protein
MKRYSTDYFKKKYQILAEKLLKKEGFVEDVKELRKKLGIPEDGFNSSPELAFFFFEKLTEEEQHTLTFFAFVEAYAIKNKIAVTDDNKDQIVDAFLKEGNEEGIGAMPAVFELTKNIEAHHTLFTIYHLFDKNKYLSKLFPAVKRLMQKYWSIDLLDDHIIFHYVEKYLFLGQLGIDQYIKSKISCPNCKYLGIDHFSPRRADMEGQDKGPFNRGYILNKKAVQRLSQHFNSVFVIIKPYATKEMTIQYIQDNWDDLKEHIVEKNPFYKQFEVNPTLIKESKEERNRLVYDLNKLSKKELLSRYKGDRDFSHKGIYKEAVISAILKDEYNIDVTPDSVKKTAARYRKSTKVRRTPKDIRDI